MNGIEPPVYFNCLYHMCNCRCWFYLVRYCSGLEFSLIRFLRRSNRFFLSPRVKTKGCCRKREGLGMVCLWDGVGVLELGAYPTRGKGGDEGPLWELSLVFVFRSSPALSIALKLSFCWATKCNIHFGAVGLGIVTVRLTQKRLELVDVSVQERSKGEGSGSRRKEEILDKNEKLWWRWSLLFLDLFFVDCIIICFISLDWKSPDYKVWQQ